MIIIFDFIKGILEFVNMINKKRELNQSPVGNDLKSVACRCVFAYYYQTLGVYIIYLIY